MAKSSQFAVSASTQLRGRSPGEALRFGFGENWSRFLEQLDPRRILAAEDSLRDLLDVESLVGRSFLDVGSGSGLFSLAARRMGARVHSFDYDRQSVACTNALRQVYFPTDRDWTVEEGSVLDREYLSELGRFDFVYSWGVLHHTGEMWRALENVGGLVAESGTLCVAIYNDQGQASRRWLAVKRTYNQIPPPLRFLVLWPATLRLWTGTFARDMLAGRLGRSWREYDTNGRGMSPWRDVVDWVGGYPFEVAKPEEVFAFYQKKGFVLRNLKTCAGGLGCNEFVFKRGGS